MTIDPLSKPTLKKTNDYIEHDSRDLRAIFSKIRLLNELNRKIKAYLEPEIAKYCQIAQFTAGIVTLIAANGSVATQLRFQQADLLRKFRQDPDPLLQQIVKIQSKVRPAQPELSARLAPDAAVTSNTAHNPSRKGMAALSPETAAIIRAAAEGIEDPKIKEIMERIAGRVKKKSE